MRIAAQLEYHPPFDWAALLRFLSARAMKGVERVGGESYFRTVSIDGVAGWIEVRDVPALRMLQVEAAGALMPVFPALLARLSHLFDLSARPDVIAARLRQDPLLAAAVGRSPGLRVPGAVDGFELVVRAILGQQITVKAATTLAGRFAEAFGEAISTPHADLARLCPRAEVVAGLSPGSLAALGVVQSRARSLIAVAGEVASGRLQLVPGADPEATMQRLVALPGIGGWTAQYVAMRALRWGDAFPREDVVLRKRLGGVTAKAAEARSRAWRPWRSYAVLHLWQSDARVASP
jgi:AraC family transcriptional regulator of adaptative response / DNA-3-methyladenine glycosylase II